MDTQHAPEITLETVASTLAAHLQNHGQMEAAVRALVQEVVSEARVELEKTHTAFINALNRNNAELSKLADTLDMVVKAPMCFAALGVASYFFHVGKLNEWSWLACLLVTLAPILGNWYKLVAGIAARNPIPRQPAA